MGLRQTYLACAVSNRGNAAQALRYQNNNHSIDISAGNSLCGEKFAAKGSFSGPENNRFENLWLAGWDGCDIFAGSGTKKGQMKSRRTVANRYVSSFFVPSNYTAYFGGFKYRAAGLPAVA